MNNLSSEDIKLIHVELEKKFPCMLSGIEKEGLIEAAIEKQSLRLYGSEEQYEGIYKKAAVLMEAITRWHIFHDGNKRTGLLCAFLYLYANQYYLAIPIDAVRFTQKIAATEGTESEEIDRLIEEIEAWLKKYTAQDLGTFKFKVVKYNLLPTLKLRILDFFGFKKHVQIQLDYLFVTKAHPEYKQESRRASGFLTSLMLEAVIKIVDLRKRSPKDLALPTLDPMRCAMAEHEVLLAEEEELFRAEPDENGVRHYDSVCFHCKRPIHLETDTEDRNGYFITDSG